MCISLRKMREDFELVYVLLLTLMYLQLDKPYFLYNRQRNWWLKVMCFLHPTDPPNYVILCSNGAEATAFKSRDARHYNRREPIEDGQGLRLYSCDADGMLRGSIVRFWTYPNSGRQ